MTNLTQISLLMVLIFWTNGSTGAAFSIEEEILQLKVNLLHKNTYLVVILTLYLLFLLFLSFVVKSDPIRG